MSAHTTPPTDRRSLASLLGSDDFVGRHIGPDDAEHAHMLATLGVASLDELIDQTVPAAIRLEGNLPMSGSRTVEDVLAELKAMAGRNAARTSLIGQGYYGTITPPVIQRNVLENPAWYTAYTPYQPEISQGRLETLLNFQTMIGELTGFPLANASLLDEATAAAEAMTMARRTSKVKSDRFLVHADTHPQTIAVLQTRAEPLGIEVVVDRPRSDAAGEAFGVLLSLPTSTGAVPDWRATDRTRSRRRRCRGRGHRPAGLRAHHSPGPAGRRHRDRLRAAVRRADGLRRPARRVHRHQRCARPLAARPPRGRQHRHRGPARAAPRAADARAAHPPREGHLQHLHRAGAARQHGRPLRQLARAGRPAPHRRAHPSSGLAGGRRSLRAGGIDAATRHLVRHA